MTDLRQQPEDRIPPVTHEQCEKTYVVFLFGILVGIVFTALIGVLL